MPEIPDLEVFSHNLTRLFQHKKIEAVHVLQAKKLNVAAAELESALKGEAVVSVERRGKELYFSFTNKQVLAIHLMLHGSLRLFENKNDHKFTILELIFESGSGLALTDFQRQATPALNPDDAKTGIDALSNKLDAKFLTGALSKSKATVKSMLLNQDIIRGIGNAYSDEILWAAQISPFSICNKIPPDGVKALAKAIKKVLNDAKKQIIKHHPDIITGEIRDFLKIHHTDKDTSPGGAAIHIKKSGSRKTYYTDEQKLFV